jgi:predicted transcriptional regulator
MAIIAYLFTAAELKALPRKHHATLLKLARRLVRTSPDIRKVVKHDPKIHRILRRKLRPTYNRMKRK